MKENKIYANVATIIIEYLICTWEMDQSDSWTNHSDWFYELKEINKIMQLQFL